MSATKENLVFFDGHCILCSRSMSFLNKRDKKKKLTFISLSELRDYPIIDNITENDSSSIIFSKNGYLYYRSDAIIEIMKSLGGIYSCFTIIKLIPKGWRDRVYNFVAQNRYKWLGKTDTNCELF